MQDKTSGSHDGGSGRRQEVAALLARAVMRCRGSRPQANDAERISPHSSVLPLVASSEILSKRSRQGLEVPGETRLTLHAG
jgi:hypothetical protein